jgi:hypothetical protein
MKRGTNGNNALDTILTIAKYEIKTQIKQRPDVCRKARKLEYYSFGYIDISVGVRLMQIF